MLTPNTMMFPGSNHVYIKYHDVLGTPRFSILNRLVYEDAYPGLYDVSFLKDKKKSELINWYINRKHENFLNDDQINMNKFTSDENENILQTLLRETEYDTFAPFDFLNIFILHPIVDHLHIYTTRQEPGISAVIEPFAQNMSDLSYNYGPFESVISHAKDQCTLITNCSDDVRKFANPKYPNRYFVYVQPNNYDPLESLSDIYATYVNRLTVIEFANRLKLWEESIT